MLDDQLLPVTVTKDSHFHYLLSRDQFILYLLVDPITNEICYIGQTYFGPSMRLQQHCNELARFQDKPKGLWINSLFDLGHAPTMMIVEKCTPETVNDREINLIEDLWEAGSPLVNTTHIPVYWQAYQTRLANSEWATMRGLSKNLLEMQA